MDTHQIKSQAEFSLLLECYLADIEVPEEFERNFLIQYSNEFGMTINY
jgi:hypothetical protein